MKPAIYLKFVLLFFILSFPPLINAVDLPNLKLTGDDGKQHRLMDYLGKGKWTTVVVWGPKCPACINEMPIIQSLYDARKTTKIDVLGLALDFPSFNYPDIKQVQQFNEDYFISFPSLLISARIYYDLGLGPLSGTPTIIIVNPEGKVSAVQLGGVPREAIEKYISQQNSK